jgi:hypothetical protein
MVLSASTTITAIVAAIFIIFTSAIFASIAIIKQSAFADGLTQEQL